MGSQLNDVMIYLAIVIYAFIWCFIGSMLSPLLRNSFHMRPENATSVMLVLCCGGFFLGLFVAFSSGIHV